MQAGDIGEWKSTVIVIGVSIAISATLPIWLWIAKICDKSNHCGKKDPNAGNAQRVESFDAYRDDGDQMSESSIDSDDRYSTFSSTVTSQLTALLESRPRRTAGRRSDRRKRRRERDIRYAAEISKLVFEDNASKVGEEIDFDDFSCAKSVLSKLSVDDISMSGTEIRPMTPRTDTQRSLTKWEKLLEVSEWEPSLASLSGFYMVQGIVENMTEIVLLAIIGHMIGTTEANVYMMTTFLIEMTSVIGVGYQEAIGVLVPQAEGAGNDLLAGRYLQIGIVFSVLSQLPGFAVWFFYMHDAILWFEFDEQTAAIAQDYTFSIFIYFLAEAINECLLEFLDVGDHEKYVTTYIVFQSFVLSGVVVGMASLGVSNMVAIGLTQSLVKLTLLFVNVCVIANKGWFRDYSEGLFRTFGLKDLRAMWTTFTTGIPLAVAWILSYGEWQVMIIFAQSIGPNEVAAWNILGYIWDFFESITEAIASAAEVRVGFRMGAGKPQLARNMSEKSIYLGVLCAVYTAGGLFVIAEFLPSWLTPNPIYQKLVFDQLPLIGFGGILMVPGLVMESILCAQGRVRLMTIIEVVVSWFIAIPMAAVLVYYRDSGLEGLLTGSVIGLSTGATILMFFILRSNWEQLSENVIQRNKAEGAQYLDTDWDELPSEVKAAASTLGYTKSMWESGKEPDTTTKSWNNLKKAQQAAARVLGYNKKKWNGENDGGNLYEEYDFDDLPPEVRNAAKFLGYTSSIWDKDGKVPLEKKDWAELTKEQQGAASVLGYTAEKWDNESDSDSSSSSSDESGIQLNNMMPSIPEERTQKFEDLDFKELPLNVRIAAKFLGYTASTWDNDEKIPIERKDWSELTRTQRKSASTLGYTQEKWDNESDSSSSSSESSAAAEKQNVDYEGLDFDKLPKNVKEAAKGLGYTRAIWDKDGKVPAESKDWSELTKKQRKAASTLGYTQEKWDNESDSSSSSSESWMTAEERNVDYEDLDFNELPKKVKEAAKVLGYTRAIWDKDGKVPLEKKDWAELTKKQQKAASTLGYTQEKWDNESDSSSLSSDDSKEKATNHVDSSFDKLPEDTKKAAKVLGHNDSTWDTCVKTPIETKEWSALTEKEREAASTLGYTKEKWNAVLDSKLSPKDCIPWMLLFGAQGRINLNESIDTINTSVCPTPWGELQQVDSLPAQPTRDYTVYKFNDLPPKVRKSAELLGFTQYTWNAKKFGHRKSKSWNSLTPKEGAAAMTLGFTAETWNALLDSH